MNVSRTVQYLLLQQLQAGSFIEHGCVCKHSQGHVVDWRRLKMSVAQGGEDNQQAQDAIIALLKGSAGNLDLEMEQRKSFCSAASDTTQVCALYLRSLPLLDATIMSSAQS